MATAKMSLEEMLLERLEKTTDPATKSEIMRRLELVQFMDARYAERDRFLEQIASDTRKCSAEQTSRLSHDLLLQELRHWLVLGKSCTSKHAMARIQGEASQVLGQIIASIWAS